MMNPLLKKCSISLFCSMLLSESTHAQYQYTQSDSLKIVRWQQESRHLPKEKQILFFAHKLLHTPYKAGTLEINDPEQVIINLRHLDCTTYVETVLALTLSVRSTQPSFRLFCQNIERLRYRNGKNCGYISRLHYFSDWIADNEHKKLVTEIGISPSDVFDGTRLSDISYMSSHPTSYIALQKHPDWIPSIREQEKKLSGQQVFYISRQTICNNPPAMRNILHDGDILATVTNVKGLDVAHLGIAKWKNGRLHWYNASRIYKKVVCDPKTLCEYLHKNPRIAGIRVVRLND